MKHLFLLAVCFLGSYTTLAQDDELEGVFDDPVKKFSLHIGTDMTRALCGTPNVKSDIRLNDKYIVDVEVGMPVFGYRLSWFGLERDVVSGIEYRLAAGRSIGSFDFWGESTIYLGMSFEQWNYKSNSLKVAEEHGYFEVGATGANYNLDEFILSDPNLFTFRRIQNRVGIDLGMYYQLKHRFSLCWGFHVSFGRHKFRFLDEDSYGVTWVPAQSSSADNSIYDRTHLYGRFSLSLKYRII